MTGRAAVGRVLREAAVHYTDPAHPPGCLIVSAAVNCGLESAEVEEAMRALRQATKAGIGARIAEDVAAGLRPEDTDVDSMAAFYAAAIQGMSVQARDGATREQLERVADLAMLAWPEGQCPLAEASSSG
ncbi:TetR family transcriptional regulator C-terminal domain-containing protein [Streptosporangium carneum]|uniref:Tetracyclin repressor-like C-terminal domain-containing protein n=1 Tax=Streptosporangium carneum TaxID=47481 RepID=A0A9W6I4C6_9ACTN|nr:hypothetical protein [Streptosporangium carneum]GLK11181.1 hypothetical protein GCM10017600_45870 [Streptosporangium carneum]